MRLVLIVAGITACCLNTSALADGLENAKKAGCMSCHAVDRKVVGPSFKDVAAKYKDEPGADAKLLKKVKGGGGGVWGKMRMPANLGKMTDEEYKTTISWILSLK
jgi:cytochrome c